MRSHTSDRVSNSTFLVCVLPSRSQSPLPDVRQQQPAPTVVNPILRIRAPSAMAGGPTPAPLAITFLSTTFSTLPKRLLPPATVQSPTSSTAGSATSSPSPEPRSPGSRKRPTNFQDLLVSRPRGYLHFSSSRV